MGQQQQHQLWFRLRIHVHSRARFRGARSTAYSQLWVAVSPVWQRSEGCSFMERALGRLQRRDFFLPKPEVRSHSYIFDALIIGEQVTARSR